MTEIGTVTSPSLFLCGNLYSPGWIFFGTWPIVSAEKEASMEQMKEDRANKTGLVATYFVVGLLCQLCLSFSVALAQPAKVFVNSAVLAIGERTALIDLKSQRIISRGENFEPNLSARPGADPRKVSEFRSVLVQDLEKGRTRYEWERELVYPWRARWEYTEVMNGLDGAVLGQDGFDSPRQRAMSASRIAARQKELRRSPVSVLIQALSRTESFLRLMDQTIRGRRQVVVSFNDNTQLVLLAIDAETRLLSKVVFVEDDPLYGDVQNEVFFADWRQVGKLKLPFERTYRVNGKTIMIEHVEAIQNDVDLSRVDFTIPDDIEYPEEWDGERGEQSSHWVLRQIALGRPVDNPSTGVSLRELAPGVMHIVGGRYQSLVIEMGEYLIVVEAPQDDRHSRKVLATLRRRFPTKSVRFVINTHFHSDHAGGLRTYVASDAIVVTSALNVQLLQDAFQALHTQVPDALHRRPRTAVIEAVSDERKFFVDENRVVIVYPIETVHVEGMLIVYLPEERVLFVADLFTPGTRRQVTDWSRDLLHTIERYDLEVDIIVGSQGGVGTLDELRRVVRSNTSGNEELVPPRASEHVS